MTMLMQAVTRPTTTMVVPVALRTVPLEWATTTPPVMRPTRAQIPALHLVERARLMTMLRLLQQVARTQNLARGPQALPTMMLMPAVMPTLTMIAVPVVLRPVQVA